METVLGTVLGVVMALAGFFAYMNGHFVSKETAAEQTKRLDEKLDTISRQIESLSLQMSSNLVRNTVDESMNALAEVLRDHRLSARDRH